MFQLPLHPVAVHFPIALIVLAPVVMAILALGSLFGKWKQRTWWIAVVLQAFILVSVFTASKLGERDEEAVEAVVSEQYIEVHEEWGEKLVWASGILFLTCLIPLFFKRHGVPQLLVALLSMGPLFLVYKTGHSGAELVYRHGAASAFSQPVSAPGAGETAVSRHSEDGEDDD